MNKNMSTRMYTGVVAFLGVSASLSVLFLFRRRRILSKRNGREDDDDDIYKEETKTEVKLRRELEAIKRRMKCTTTSSESPPLMSFPFLPSVFVSEESNENTVDGKTCAHAYEALVQQHVYALAYLTVHREISREEWSYLLALPETAGESTTIRTSMGNERRREEEEEEKDRRLDVFLPFARLVGTSKYTNAIHARCLSLACIFHVNCIYDIVKEGKERKSPPKGASLPFNLVLHVLEDVLRRQYGADLFSVIFEKE